MFIEEHVKEFSEMPYNQVAIFLQGSQNYHLEYENSDVDTKAIICPSFEDIVRMKQPISTTHIRDNNEHIDLVECRYCGEIEVIFTSQFNYDKRNLKLNKEKAAKRLERI